MSTLILDPFQIFGSVAPSVEDVIWENFINSAVENVDELHKTGGITGDFDAAANSTKSINDNSDAFMEFTMPIHSDANNHRLFVGLTNDNPDPGKNSIDFAWGFAIEGAIQENGLSLGGSRPYSAGDIFKISLESGVIKYYINDILEATSIRSVTLPLMVKASLRDDNAFAKSVKIFDSNGLIPTP